MIYDEEDELFKIWVHLWKHEAEELAATKGLYGYLTSEDGVVWRKPLINEPERNQVFLQYGEHKREWDWGQLYAYHAPVVFDDKIWIYYTGLGSRHWSNYHGDDRPPKSGIGLATLRLDGFVSVQPRPDQQTGTLTTRPFVFLGEEIQINADASKGSLRVEVLNANAKPIEGFTAADCRPFRGDELRHAVHWMERPDWQQLQGRPIRLRFYLDRSKLYSFTPSHHRLADP